MKRSVLLMLPLFALLTAACAQAPAAATSLPVSWGASPTLADDQGAVTVEIVPLNLDDPGETLDFKVTLDTHSVDLSMDLAALASLTTNSGASVRAVKWDAPLGGHHVSGTLSFPSTAGGRALLKSASSFTVTLAQVDSADRVFTWNR